MMFSVDFFVQSFASQAAVLPLQVSPRRGTWKNRTWFCGAAE